MTAATRPLPIERALKTDVLTAYWRYIKIVSAEKNVYSTYLSGFLVIFIVVFDRYLPTYLCSETSKAPGR